MDYNILYPFSLRASQGGMFSAAHKTAFSKIPLPFEKLIFRTTDSGDSYFLGNAEIIPVQQGTGILPNDSWWREDFIFQHLQAYSNEMIPEKILREMYKDLSIHLKIGSLEYLVEFFKKYPSNLSTQIDFCRRFHSILNSLNNGDTLNIQGPVWFIPFIATYGDMLKRKGVRLVLVEQQPIPKDLDKTPLGERLIPCYLRADILYVHASIYSDRLAKMTEKKLPDLKTFSMGIDTAWIDGSLRRFVKLSDIQRRDMLTIKQQKLIKAVIIARNTVKHRFICVDRLDPMKGSHALIEGIKLFLDEAFNVEGLAYKSRYQFVCIHELFGESSTDYFNPKNKYIDICKKMYNDLDASHPGMVYVSESFTSRYGHRELLPALMYDSSIIAHLGQEGCGLAGLEGAYVNRHQDVGLIIGNQAGFFLEAERSGFGNLVHPVIAGNANSVATALKDIVFLREKFPGHLRSLNEKFVSDFVLKRKSTMIPDC